MGKKIFHNNIQVKGDISGQRYSQRVRNNTGSTISANTFVAIDAYNSSTGIADIKSIASQGDISLLAGYLTSALANGEYGEIIIKGEIVSTKNTTGRTIGDLLYGQFDSGTFEATSSTTSGNGPFRVLGKILTIGTNAHILLNIEPVSFNASPISGQPCSYEGEPEGVYPDFSIDSTVYTRGFHSPGNEDEQFIISDSVSDDNLKISAHDLRKIIGGRVGPVRCIVVSIEDGTSSPSSSAAGLEGFAALTYNAGTYKIYVSDGTSWTDPSLNISSLHDLIIITDKTAVSGSTVFSTTSPGSDNDLFYCNANQLVAVVGPNAGSEAFVEVFSTTSTEHGEVLFTNDGTPSWTLSKTGQSSVSTFLDLTDTPNSYTANQLLRVNAAGTEVEHSGVVISTNVLLHDTGASNNNIATELAVKTYVDNAFSTQIIRREKVQYIVDDIVDVLPVVGASATGIAGHAVIHDVAGDGSGSWNVYIHDINTGLWIAGESDFDGRIILVDSNITCTHILAGMGVSDNCICDFDGALELASSPEEGYVTYVDEVDGNDGNGLDAVYIDDGAGHELWELRPASVTSFLGLSDTPSAYDADKVLVTNAAGNAVGFRDLKDEDDMASDDDTALATQQSIKAYVDGKTHTSITAQTVTAADVTVDTIALVSGQGYSISYQYLVENVTTGSIFEAGRLTVVAFNNAGTITTDITRESTSVLGSGDTDDFSFKAVDGTGGDFNLDISSTSDDFKVKVTRLEIITF